MLPIAWTTRSFLRVTYYARSNREQPRHVPESLAFQITSVRRLDCMKQRAINFRVTTTRRKRVSVAEHERRRGRGESGRNVFNEASDR